MRYPSLAALLANRATALPVGPVCLIIIEDNAAIDSTIRHHAALGFRSLVVFCPAEVTLPEDIKSPLHRVDHAITPTQTLPDIVNPIIAALPGQWIYYCFNGEYLFFPFSEQRSVGEMLGFMTEERRDSVMSQVVDLYARDLTTHPDAVDPSNAWLDGSGYYSATRQDQLGHPIDRQFSVYGGLRWRFEEHIAPDRRRLERVALFRATKGLTIGPDGRFSDAEYNTHACPWHHNLTVAICSFRAAKALRRNPGSRDAINTFHWPKSVRFNWQAQQLLDLGLMEPGQWF
ncbi:MULTISPECIES: hypothetical protein [unclassified Yoonia]|uniref:hypothetical protein n=1 Tax=unclassified Yoonia TaxID=2629118 RepID=UPI002AFE62E2|nr:MULTISPECIES: hypothetical protein [unclassified Yoonia]